MQGYKLTIRLIAMGLLVSALVFLMGGRLIGLQLAGGADYETASERFTTRIVTIPAARGCIFDRNGRLLVGNRVAYNVTLDRAQLFSSEKASETVLKLIRAAGACGETYADTLLPVTLPPFSFTEMSAEQEKYLLHYLEKKGWPADLTAAELMDRLFDDYGMTGDLKGAEGLLDGLSVYEARLAAGVLYEIDLRYQALGFEPYMHIPAYSFSEDVSMEMISRVKENGYPGADIATVTVREYYTSSAAHILGRVGPIQGNTEAYQSLGYKPDELVGVDGAELAFEQWLHGTSGERREEIDSQGRVAGVTEIREAQPGQNIYLTIDIRLQEELERLLASGIQNLAATGAELRGREAEAGAAVIENPNTGEILAAANYPTYNPSTFLQDFETLRDDPLKPLYNRAVSGTYAPGSTFKMVTAAAALENGVVSTSTKIYDHGVFTYYTSPQPKCSGNHGSVSISEAIKVSCNYFFFDVGRQTGIEQINYWANRFGLGLPTGIELEDENRTTLGYVAGPETSKKLGVTWYPGNTLSAAIGQDNHQFTPVQLANYISAIANGGTLYKAHLLKEVLSYDSSYEYYLSQPQSTSVGLSAQTLTALQQGMYMVTHQGGTAYSVFRDFPIEVAGKTGSVQSGDRPNNGVFVAYAPYNNPKIALSLVVEKGGAGSAIAPIARDIIAMYFRLQEDMKNVPAEGGLVR